MSWKIPLALITDGDEPTLYSSRGVPMNLFDRDGTPTKKCKPVPNWVTDKARVNQAWLTIAISLASSCPSLMTGLDTYDETVQGVLELYTFLFYTTINQGYRVMVSYLKCLKNWALYYACNARGDEPAIPDGMIGRRQDGSLGFPWARGQLGPLLVAQLNTGLDQKVSHALFQLYLIGKALPIPGEDKVSSVLDQHKSDYSRVMDMPNLTAVCERYAEGYSDWLFNKTPDEEVVLNLKFGPAACIGSPRADGGKDQIARELLTPYRDELVTVPNSRKVWFSIFGETAVHSSTLSQLQVTDGLIRIPRKYLYLTYEQILNDWDNDQFLARDLALGRLFDRGVIKVADASRLHVGGNNPFESLYFTEEDYPHDLCEPPERREVKISVVLERGDKARPINLSDWEFAVLGNIPREYAYHLMSRDPEIPTLMGDSGGEGLLRTISEMVANKYTTRKWGLLTEQQQQELIDLELFSLDLSRCSDLILGSMADAFQRGFFRGSRACESGLLARLWLLNAGSRKVVYPDGTFIEKCNRAPMMGDPPTWWIDNIYTRFVSTLGSLIADLGISTETLTSNEFDMLLGDLDSQGLLIFDFDSVSLRVRCGDDEFKMGAPSEHIAIIDCYRLCGGKISEGTNIRSLEFGVFCESHFVKGSCARPGEVLHWVDILRIKSLSNPDAGRGSSKDLPSYWTRGLAARTATSWWPESSNERQLAEKVTTLLNYDFIKEAYNQGLQVYLPSELGGLSYPSLDLGWARANQLTKRMLRTICGLNPADLEPGACSLLQSLGSVFTLSVSGNMFVYEDQLSLEEFSNSIFEIGVKTVDELAFDNQANPGDYPYSKLTEFTKPQRLGVGGEVVNLSIALRIARQRLIQNRGMHSVSTSGLLCSNNRALNIYRDLASKICGLGEPLDVIPGNPVATALQLLSDCTKSYFTTIETIDSLIPDQVAKIYY